MGASQVSSPFGAELPAHTLKFISDSNWGIMLRFNANAITSYTTAHALTSLSLGIAT